jgi:hypothetical protein
MSIAQAMWDLIGILCILVATLVSAAVWMPVYAMLMPYLFGRETPPESTTSERQS